MTESLTSAVEARTLEQVAQEYRRKGYEVVVQPGAAHLPRSFAKLTPDILARRGNEVVVVEVKSRENLRQAPLASELAKAVQAQPGWRFELVIANPEHQIPMPGGAEAWQQKEVQKRLQEAQGLFDTGHEEAALVLTWSAAEAAMRLAILREGLPMDRPDAAYLMKQLAFEGVLSRHDYNVLWRAMELRNAVAHGHRPPELDPRAVRDVLAIASRLLEDEAA